MWASTSSDFGVGFYFSSTPFDASVNYAGEGPDLTARIDTLTDRQVERDDFDGDPDQVKAQVRSQLSQGVPNMMPAYLSIQRPLLVGGPRETYFDFDEGFNPVTEEYGEPFGLLVDLVNALREMDPGEVIGFDPERVIADLFEEAQGDGLSASEVVKTMRNSVGLIDAIDPNSDDSPRCEIIRKAFEEAGFDGIIDRSVYEKFGRQRGRAGSMEGLNPATVHYIAFRPEQIKSSIGNRGSYNPRDPDIRFSVPSTHGDGDPSRPFDFSSDERFRHLFYGDPTAQEIKAFSSWLRARPNAFVRLYHGTAAVHPIEEQGILPTSATRRNSLQSARGYVCLSVYPGSAYEFGSYAALNRPQAADGARVAVYPVTRTVRSLLADLDQLYNRRMFAGETVGNSLAESLVHGRGARVRGRVDPVSIGAPRRFRASDDEIQGQMLEAARQAVPALSAFERWFDQSKAVDERGMPLVLYHGTVVRDSEKAPGMGDITAFDRMFTTRFRRPSIDTVGSWFSTNPGEGGAAMYAGNAQGSAIYPVHLSIKNPQVTTFALMTRRARLLANGTDDGRPIGVAEVDAYRQWLKATGKDGIKIESSGSDDSTEFDKQEAWIALEPEQIKSAIGNRGTFDGSNPDIRFSVAAPDRERVVSREEALHRWFGDSKVVEATGKPLVVYHGGQKLTEWNARGDESQIYGGHAEAVKREWGSGLSALEREHLDHPVHFFTDDRMVAEGYGDQGDRYEVRRQYLRMERPMDLRVDVVGRDAVQASLRQLLGNEYEMPFDSDYNRDRSISQSLRWNWSAIGKSVKALGYDGIILYDTDVLDRGRHTSYAVFEPTQIKSVDANRGTFDPDNPDIRFSFAGRHAATADLAALRSAELWDAAGADAEAERARAGWFKGVDGKWRFEIDDSKARVLPALKTLAAGGYDACEIASITYRKHDDGLFDVSLNPPNPKRVADFVQLNRVTRAVVDALIPQDLVLMMERGEGAEDLIGNFEPASRIAYAFEFGGMNVLPLDQVLEHTALFEAYPHLRTLSVQVIPSMGLGASLSEMEDGTHVIRVGLARQLSNLMHEIQHAIQNREGFAAGGSPDVFVARQSVALPMQTLSLALSIQEMSERSGLSVDRIKASPPRFLRDAPAQAWNLAGDRTPQSLKVEFDFAMSALSPQESYRRLAGEVEARNVQSRLDFDEDKRRQIPPSQTADACEDEQLLEPPCKRCVDRE